MNLDDVKKLLKTLVDGQSLIFDEIKSLKKEISSVKNELNERLDKLGLQLDALEDDAPTLEDHEELVGRVDKLEQKVASM